MVMIDRSSSLYLLYWANDYNNYRNLEWLVVLFRRTADYQQQTRYPIYICTLRLQNPFYYFIDSNISKRFCLCLGYHIDGSNRSIFYGYFQRQRGYANGASFIFIFAKLHINFCFFCLVWIGLLCFCKLQYRKRIFGRSSIFAGSLSSQNTFCQISGSLI